MDELCSKYGFKYEVKTADIDEKAIRSPVPRELVLALGHAKAEAILDKMRTAEDNMDGYLVTCDQVS